MSERDALLANCLADPADDTARLVYADWLRENDSPLGRFIWAGVILSRFRGAEPVEDGMFFDAQKELHATALAVISPQLKDILGPDWGWNQNDSTRPDVLTAAVLPKYLNPAGRAAARRVTRTAGGKYPCATYERGMIRALRLTLDRFREVAAKVLVSCPLERVDVLDVPGMSLAIVRAEAGWHLSAELVITAERRFTLITRRARTIKFKSVDFSTREKLIELIGRAAEDLVAAVRSEAGADWPGPGEPIASG